MKYKVEAEVCAILLEDLKKDLNLHMRRHVLNEHISEEFAWSLNKVNNNLREALFNIAQILPKEKYIESKENHQ